MVLKKGGGWGCRLSMEGGWHAKFAGGFPYFYITFTKKKKCLVIPDLFSIII